MQRTARQCVSRSSQHARAAPVTAIARTAGRKNSSQHRHASQSAQSLGTDSAVDSASQFYANDSFRRVLLWATLAAAAASLTTTTLLQSEKARGKSREPSKADFEACLAELRAVLPAGALSDDLDELRSHVGNWIESQPDALPGFLVMPYDTDQVVLVINACRRHRIPIVPYGAGTNIEGSTNAPCCGLPASKGQKVGRKDLQPGFSVMVDLGAHMNEVLEVHEDDLQVTVQPGVGYEQLNAHLQEMGVPLFFAVDPGPGATVGGMVATGSSGTNAVRYQTMREAVLSLKVVLPSGEVIKTRSRAIKSSAGPDLTKLFVGSEGTLGIIVEATLKLHPILPSSVALLSCSDVKTAASIVADMLKQGVSVQCCELLDENLVRAVNEASKRNRDGLRRFDETPTLLIKLQGDEAARAVTQKRIAHIARSRGCNRIELSQSDKESESLWRARKVALNSALDMRRGMPYHSTDVCVPISRFPILAEEFKAELDRLSFPFAGLVGHAGDGNLHSIILYETPQQDQAAVELADRMARRAIALGGTCSGEHGIGTGKKHLLRAELGGSLDLLRSIKAVVDPYRIMNPAVLIPEEG